MLAALKRIPARVQAMDPDRVDIGLALLAALASVLEALLLNAHGHSRAVTLVCGVVLSSSVVIRRRSPLLAPVVFAVPVLVSLLLDGFLTLYATTPFAVLLLLLYSSGRHLDGWPVVVAAATLILPLEIALIADDAATDGASQYIWPVLLLVPPVAIGRTLRRRSRLQARLRETAAELEDEREIAAARAVDEERERIAGELQAVVANGVSAMVVQAEAVPRVLAAGDVDSARTALATVEETGREALVEMRRLLGVLRRDHEGPELEPQPGLGQLHELRERGALDVDVVVEGEPRELQPGLDLAAFRVLQEALAGAAAAGATRATLRVRYGERGIALEVTDDRPAGAPDPLLLAALRERVGLYDGHLRVEAVNGSGWSLVAGFPLGARS